MKESTVNTIAISAVIWFMGFGIIMGFAMTNNKITGLPLLSKIASFFIMILISIIIIGVTIYLIIKDTNREKIESVSDFTSALFTPNWEPEVEYKKGTIVFSESVQAEFKCVNDHLSSEANKPPNGQYWIQYPEPEADENGNAVVNTNTDNIQVTPKPTPNIISEPVKTQIAVPDVSTTIVGGNGGNLATNVGGETLGNVSGNSI